MLNVIDFRNQGKALATVNLKSITPLEISEIGWDKSNSFLVCVGG
jgi:hypothetical protein